MKRKADKANQLTPAWKQAREEAIQRCQAKNNSDGTLANTRRNTIYVALEFERLGINGPEDISQEDFVAWTKGLKDGTLGTKQLGPMTIKKTSRNASSDSSGMQAFRTIGFR